MANILLPPPTQCPIATPTGALTTPWGNYFTLLGNNLANGGNYAPANVNYIVGTNDQSGTLTNAQVLGNLQTGFVKVANGSGQLSSTGSTLIQSSDLSTTGVIAGSYGDGTHVATFSVDSQGRIDSVSSVTITGAAPTGSAGGNLTGNYPNPIIAANVITGTMIQNTTITDSKLTHPFLDYISNTYFGGF